MHRIEPRSAHSAKSPGSRLHILSYSNESLYSVIYSKQIYFTQARVTGNCLTSTGSPAYHHIPPKQQPPPAAHRPQSPHLKPLAAPSRALSLEPQHLELTGHTHAAQQLGTHSWRLGTHSWQPGTHSWRLCTQLGPGPAPQEAHGGRRPQTDSPTRGQARRCRMPGPLVLPLRVCLGD